MQVAIDSQIFMEESSTVTQNLSNLSEEYPYIIVKTDEDIWEYESKLNGTKIFYVIIFRVS